MKVLLLNPPAKGGQSRDRCETEGSAWLNAFPPTTFASIAGCVREKYPLSVMDCVGSGTGYEKAKEQAIGYHPDYIVLNTSTPTIDSDIRIAGEISKACGAKVIAFGEYVTSRYAELLSAGLIDYAILGEPETPVMRILAGEPNSCGVAMAGWDGGKWMEPDLDSLPFPAYDLLPVYRYPLTGERWMFVRTGRGCPYKCIYCIEPSVSPKPRTHSIDYLIRQFKWLIDDLNIRVFMLWEDVATFDKQHMISLCERMVEEGLNRRCKWFCTTRVDRFDDEVAHHMAAAGCRMMTFGFESGNQEVLDLNRKGITLQQSREAVRAAKKNGIMTIGHFIIGLVGDNPKRARETARFARELGLDFAQFYVATPFPGSEFYRMAKEKGWIDGADMRGVQQGIASVSYPDFTKNEMQRERRDAFLRFYLRPQAVISSIRARSLSNLLMLPFQALKFSGWALK